MAGKGVARLGDKDAPKPKKPPNTKIQGNPTVRVNGKPVHTVGMKDDNSKGGPHTQLKGSPTVRAGGRPLARLGDTDSNSDQIIKASQNVKSG